MGFLSWVTQDASPEAIAAREASAHWQAEIVDALHADRAPPSITRRLQDARAGRLPWIATLTPAELMIVRSHGIRPISAVSATCWMQFAREWTNDHTQGWQDALRRLRAEAIAGGANAVLDVKMRSITWERKRNMDFSLVGTAVSVDGLQSSEDPVIATVPTLEFIKLLEADIVPTGIVIASDTSRIDDWESRAYSSFTTNTECLSLSEFWQRSRRNAHTLLLETARSMGNSVLAHSSFSEAFEVDAEHRVARYVVIATTVDTGRNQASIHASVGKRPGSGQLHQEFVPVFDLHAGKTPLANAAQHHQSYRLNDEESVI